MNNTINFMEGTDSSLKPYEKFTEELHEENVLMPELGLPFRWTIWEQYEIKDSKDYSGTMTKVACFQDLLSFWKIWSNMPHSDPANFFSIVDAEGNV